MYFVNWRSNFLEAHCYNQAFLYPQVTKSTTHMTICSTDHASHLPLNCQFNSESSQTMPYLCNRDCYFFLSSSGFFIETKVSVTRMNNCKKLSKYLKYRKAASSSLSRLVELFLIFRRLMKGKFDAYVLWPLAKKF